MPSGDEDLVLASRQPRHASAIPSTTNATANANPKLDPASRLTAITAAAPAPMVITNRNASASDRNGLRIAFNVTVGAAQPNTGTIW